MQVNVRDSYSFRNFNLICYSLIYCCSFSKFSSQYLIAQSQDNSSIYIMLKSTESSVWLFLLCLGRTLCEWVSYPEYHGVVWGMEWVAAIIFNPWVDDNHITATSGFFKYGWRSLPPLSPSLSDCGLYIYILSLTMCVMWRAAPSVDDEFEKWQKEVREAEAEAEVENGLLNSSAAGVSREDDTERPSTPPEGEEEFTDDDGTTYKWNRGLRAWVPQVCLWHIHCLGFVLL